MGASEPCQEKERMNRAILTGLAVAVGSSMGGEPIRVRITGAWEVTVGPGALRLEDGRTVTVNEDAVTVPVHAPILVEKERHPRLRVFAEKAAGWRRGERLKALVTQECSAAGALIPETVKAQAEDGTELSLNADFRVEGGWGTVGRVDGGKIGPNDPVSLSYRYYPNRLHAIAISGDGSVRLVEGTPGVGIQQLPELTVGETLIATVWLSGRVTAVAEDNLFVLDGTPPPASEWFGKAEERLPSTMAKLRNGEPLTIVAWGDSVTNGGGVGGDRTRWYQHVFVAGLRQRFPTSDIALRTAAWPGGNSRGYMAAPPGGKYDFKRDVLDPKPGLVTIEFVNDAGLHGEALEKHYGKIMAILRENGSEVILITPHFVRPDWMRVTSLKFDDDPRPYVKGLRQFARENDVAVADAALLWGHLWREGIPYMTLEGNSINHPDTRGHRMFADALLGVFPEK